MRVWYYVVGDEKKGPIPEEELISLSKFGELPSETLVWTEGMETWAQIDAAEALRCLPASVASPEQESPIVEIVDTEVTHVKRKNRPVSQVRPWTRYWARWIDYSLFGLILGILLSFVAPQVLLIDNLLYGVCIGALFLFIEAAMLSWWGTTPGKWIMQIRVLKKNGGKLTYSNALGRAFNVWMYGLGFGVPLVSLITHIRAYDRLRKRSVTSWDEDGPFVVSHGRVGFFRALFAIIILIIFYGILPAFGSM